MRVLRSSLFVAATAIVAAACGDKVNVVGPSSGAGQITSVQVAPATATLSVGQSLTFTAAVNATTGITPTVTWSANAPGGVFLATVASPGLAVCATASATGVASVINCATVVVQPASTVVPAVLQIASITIAGNLNAPVPVPPAAVAGQINVSVNLNPGTEHMDSVNVLVNGIVAAQQTFTDAQAALLRSVTTDKAGDQALQSTLVFSINTAAYATAGCATQIAPCGKPTFLNGPAAISVVGYGKQGSSPVTSSSTSGVNLLFGNADAWIVAQTLGAGTATAASAAGFNYSGGPTGSVAVTAVPVAYSGLTIASANINFGTAACDASGNAQRTLVATAPVAPSLAWTATFTRTAGKIASVKTVDDYEFGAGLSVACTAANAAGGEGAAVGSSLYTTNTTGPVGFAGGSTIPVVRLDDRAPGAVNAITVLGNAPAMVVNVNGRLNSWINAAVSMTTKNAVATPNGEAVAGTADGGVGGYVFNLRVGAAGAGGIVDPVIALTPVTSYATVPTLTNTSLCAVISAKDLLGNESALPVAGTVCLAPPAGANAAVAATAPAAGVNSTSTPVMFGGDIAPPTIAIAAGSIAASSAGVGSTGANVGGEFQFAVLDTGTIGNSGMLATGPVIGTVTLRTATVATAAQQCVAGTFTVATGLCTASATGFGNVAFPLVSTNVVAAQTIFGYYTVNAQGIDAAGNISTNTVTRVRSYNLAANVPALTASLFSTPLTGPTATFTATGSSGNTTAIGATSFFDLWKVSFNLTYAGGLAGPLLYPSTVIQQFNTAPFVNSNVPVTISIAGFIRQVENQTSACNAALAVGGAFKPNQLQEALLDQVSNTSGNVNTPIAGASVAAGVSYVGVAAPVQTFSFIESNGVTEQPAAGCPGAAGANAVVKVNDGASTSTSVDPTSVTLTADAFGPTATYQPPFAQVNFYVLVGANLELIGSTTSFATTDDGSAQGRKHSYTFAWTPGTKTPISAQTYAAGVGATPQSSAGCAVGATNFQIYAVGVSAAGDGLVSPLNANVCLTNAP